MTQQSAERRYGLMQHGPAWLALLISCAAIYQNYTGGIETNAKVEKALTLAERALVSQLGEPLILEEEREVVVPRASVSSAPPLNADSIFTIRNDGGDSIVELWVTWLPMNAPLAEEVPDYDTRMAITKRLSEMDKGSSTLAKKILAVGETTGILNLPNTFDVCFDYPNVEFYGLLKLGWRHRVDPSMSQVKVLNYKAVANGSKLTIETTDFIFFRGLHE